ncbi:PREDICTED: uncharacterized protein LOC109148364, partial [Ipomoea nil]|uniref:uncharacterized protein LOC109148364 n=1 Tax=Ipomoea nil TaxID=35883 RepID=UPI0009012690
MAALDFYAGVPVPRAISSAQIVLIPKKCNPDTFADFRPICLCTFISKIFTRILVTRLIAILPRLISNEQSGFVEGRNFQNNVLLSFELLQYLDKRCGGSNVVIKLDMMKAFEKSLGPSFAALTKFGVPGTTLITRVMNNLEATRLSVLINGHAKDFVDENSILATDGLVWKLSPYGNFTFSSAYEALLRGRMQLVIRL